MDDALFAAIEAQVGAGVGESRSLPGGDICEAWRLELEDGRRCFAKSLPDAPPRFFTGEAEGLGWLAEADALRVPSVLAACDDGASFLVLEWIEASPRAPDFDERLGRGLASLHAFGADAFGQSHDHYIGRLPQANASCERWADFYRERRLVPQLRRACESRALDASWQLRFDALFGRLEELVGPDEPPARLHGDLWSGNFLVDAEGGPVLIDPAAYGGHREVDLAMMQLFGGFASRVFDAYAEAAPLAPAAAERVALYQLYPLLVHVNLFGESYLGSLDAALSSVGF